MLRFTIRDVLWLMVVVAMELGWAIERRQYATPTVWQRRAGAAAEFLKDSGYQTIWKDDSVIINAPDGRSVGYTARQ